MPSEGRPFLGLVGAGGAELIWIRRLGVGHHIEDMILFSTVHAKLSLQLVDLRSKHCLSRELAALGPVRCLE